MQYSCERPDTQRLGAKVRSKALPLTAYDKFHCSEPGVLLSSFFLPIFPQSQLHTSLSFAIPTVQSIILKKYQLMTVIYFLIYYCMCTDTTAGIWSGVSSAFSPFYGLQEWSSVARSAEPRAVAGKPRPCPICCFP